MMPTMSQAVLGEVLEDELAELEDDWLVSMLAARAMGRGAILCDGDSVFGFVGGIESSMYATLLVDFCICSFLQEGLVGTHLKRRVGE